MIYEKVKYKKKRERGVKMKELIFEEVRPGKYFSIKHGKTILMKENSNSESAIIMNSFHGNIGERVKIKDSRKVVVRKMK